jgi:hypothetical protein
MTWSSDVPIEKFIIINAIYEICSLMKMKMKIFIAWKINYSKRSLEGSISHLCVALSFPSEILQWNSKWKVLNWNDFWELLIWVKWKVLKLSIFLYLVTISSPKYRRTIKASLYFHMWFMLSYGWLSILLNLHIDDFQHFIPSFNKNFLTFADLIQKEGIGGWNQAQREGEDRIITLRKTLI